MHAAHESIVDRDSRAFSLIRRLQGGSELSSDLLSTLIVQYSRRGRNLRHAAAGFERMGASAPNNVGASDSVAGW